MLRWIAARRPGVDVDALRATVVVPIPGRAYAGGVHVDRPRRPSGRWWRHPAIPTTASRPTRRTAPTSTSSPTVPIDIAYGGSCTAGKEADLDLYAQVMREALDAGRRVKDGVEFFIQFGSEAVEEYARAPAATWTCSRRPACAVIHPGCGACIGCGPGRVESARAGDGLRDQPQLPEPLGPGPALPGVAAHRRRLRGRRPHRRVSRGMFAEKSAAS